MNPWMITASMGQLIAHARSLPVAEGLGYVYVLNLSNNTRKIGSTANLGQRLHAHQADMRRYGVHVELGCVTRRTSISVKWRPRHCAA